MKAGDLFLEDRTADVVFVVRAAYLGALLAERRERIAALDLGGGAQRRLTHAEREKKRPEPAMVSDRVAAVPSRLDLDS